MGGGGKESKERDFEEALELGGVEVLALLALARHEGTRAVGAFERVVAILHPCFDGLRIHIPPSLIAVQLLGQLLSVKMIIHSVLVLLSASSIPTACKEGARRARSQSSETSNTAHGVCVRARQEGGQARDRSGRSVSCMS